MTKPAPPPDPLAQLLATAAQPVHGKPCGVHEWATANPDRAPHLADALEKTRHEYTRISDAIGGGISENVIGHHARGKCSCWRVPGRWQHGRRTA